MNPISDTVWQQVSVLATDQLQGAYRDCGTSLYHHECQDIILLMTCRVDPFDPRLCTDLQTRLGWTERRKGLRG